MLMGKLMHSKIYNWSYDTEPEPELDNRRIYWPRGKALGGTSTINGMIYVRGNAADYDRWAQMGNPGWSYAEVLPYLPQIRRSCRAARRISWRGRPAVGLPRPWTEPALRSLCRGRGPGRLSPERRLQWGRPGRLRPLRLHHPQRQALQHVARFPPPGDAAAEPHRRHPCTDGADRRRERPRRRGRLRAWRRAAPSLRGARGRALRRRRQLAADPDALRDRRRGRTESARHRRGRAICPASARTSRTMSTSAWSTK